MLKKALGIEEICKICHVTPATVLRWIQMQNLKTVRMAVDQPKVWRSDLILFLESIKEPVPRELVLIDTLHIIVASHENALRTWIRNQLRALLPNATITEASDAFEAGQFTVEATPHMLILDFTVPGLDGCAVCRKMKNINRYKFMKIIAIGNQEQEKRKKEILESGADEFFIKPLIPGSFKDAVVFLVNELV